MKTHRESPLHIWCASVDSAQTLTKATTEIVHLSIPAFHLEDLAAKGAFFRNTPTIYYCLGREAEKFRMAGNITGKKVSRKS